MRIRALGWGIAVALGLPGVAFGTGTGTGPTVTYADGLEARVAAVEIMSSADAATCDDDGVCRPGETSGDRLVRVTVALALPADAPSALPLDVVAGTASGIALTAGGRIAAIDCGNMAETTVLCTDNSASVPAFVAPGGEVRLSESFDVPQRDLTRLKVTFQPPVSNEEGANPLPPVDLWVIAVITRK